MTCSNGIQPNETEFEGWSREADGSLRLWPMQGFSCRAIYDGLPVMRIDFLYPPGHDVRAGKLQVHMSPQQAKDLSSALLSALRSSR